MKKRLLLVNDEMTMGGVARIVTTLLKYIDREKYSVDLLVLDKRGEMLQEIPEDIKVIEGPAFFQTIAYPLSECHGKRLFAKLRLLIYMKSGLIKKKIAKERAKIIQEPYDIEFSCKEGFCTIFNAYGNSRRKINWVQVDYQEHNYAKHHMALMKEALQKIDQNIACSQKVADAYRAVFDIEKITVVNNPIDEERIRFLSDQPLHYRNDDARIKLITVARFHQQKGLDRLLRIYPQIKDAYHLTIIGDGELREDLFKQAHDLHIYDDIAWLGMMDNPYPEIKNSDLFIMTSYYEGYPTITLESLISTTPVLTTEVAGVQEQLLEAHMGWIVANDEGALLNQLVALKDQKALLKAYKLALKDYHYDNQTIMEKVYQIWEGTQDEHI